MKKAITTLLIIVMLAASTCTAAAGTSDHDLAKDWKAKHCKGGHIEKVITIAQGGYKGRVKGSKWTVKYPVKVKKGKRVPVYMVIKKGDVRAMICLGKVK